MPGPRSAEFKRRAVALAQLPGASVAQVAEDLNVSESAIRRWMRQAKDVQNGEKPADVVALGESVSRSGEKRWEPWARVAEVLCVALALVISAISLLVALKADRRLASEEELELADQVLVVVDPYFMRETGSGITVRNYARLPLQQLVVWVPTGSQLGTSPATSTGSHYSVATPPGPCEEVQIEFDLDFPPTGEGIVAFQDANGQFWQRSRAERAKKVSERVMQGIWDSATESDQVETRSPIPNCTQAS